MKILGKKIELGESVQLRMDFAKLYTHTSVEIPVFIERGRVEGPCLLLMGGIHGDEVNGVEIVRHIVNKGLNKPEKGTVICIPLLNVFGFLNKSREFPDGRDLNRMFPGAKHGSLASRFAYALMQEIVPNVDYCIDFHTGGAQRFNAPQVRINDDEETLRLAQIFDPNFIIMAKNREQSFRDSMVKQGKKVMLFEGGKSLNLDRYVTEKGIQGALNVMHTLELRDFTGQVSKKKDALPIIIKKSTWIRAKYSGMFRPSFGIGEKVEKGLKLGSISDPFGEVYKMFKNTKEGYVIGLNQSPLVNQGDALFHIGYV